MKDITDMEKDRQYMKMALELAQKGMGFTAPGRCRDRQKRKSHWPGISQKIR